METMTLSTSPPDEDSAVATKWNELPVEVKEKILRYLPPLDLSLFASSSEASRSLVRSLYFDSQNGFKNLFAADLLDSRGHLIYDKSYARKGPSTMLRNTVALNLLTEVGLTMGAVLHPTDSIEISVQLVFTFMDKLGLDFPLHMSANPAESEFPFHSWGRLINGVASDFSERACRRMFTLVGEKSRADDLKLRFLGLRSGCDPDLEAYLRALYRGLFLDGSRDDERKALWLELILEDHGNAEKVKLLYLLYGPVLRCSQIRLPIIIWSHVNHNFANDAHHNLAIRHLGQRETPRTCLLNDLSFALRLLNAEKPINWSLKQVVVVINTFLSLESWTSSTVALFVDSFEKEIKLRVLRDQFTYCKTPANLRFKFFAMVLDSIMDLTQRSGKSIGWIHDLVESLRKPDVCPAVYSTLCRRVSAKYSDPLSSLD